MNSSRVSVLGVPIDCVDMSQALSIVDEMVCGNKESGTIIAVNPEKILKARSDLKLMKFLNDSRLLIPDGIGAVFAARWLTKQDLKRVPGADLMVEICRQSVAKEYKLFLLGASPEVNKAVKLELERIYPGINIVGVQHGYFSDSEVQHIKDEINHSGAQILFVALGSPRQELWMETHLPDLNVRICQGVGGTFDVIAGKVKRAPKLFQKLNMEWFYRLISDPKRLVRQTALPKFVFLMVAERIKLLSKSNVSK